MKNSLDIQGVPGQVATCLQALYKGRTYDAYDITGGARNGGAAFVIHFAPSDGVLKENGLNTILLMTNCDGTYKATGISYKDAATNKIKFYSMGDNLEIKVDALASEAIKKLKFVHPDPSSN